MKKKNLNVMSSIGHIYGNDKEKMKRIHKVYNIYLSNRFENGLGIKTSRFNHSCQPNAYIDGQNQLGSISNIKKGEEITISYLDDFVNGMRKCEFRQQNLFQLWFFICSCDTCEKDTENDNQLEKLMKEVEEYHKSCKKAFEIGQVKGHEHYPLEMCRKEISCYKQIYKIAKDKKINSASIFRILERAFGAASLGYQLHEVDDLKNDAINFARTAEKFGKILGKIRLNRGVPDFWKTLYEALELQMFTQYSYGAFYQILSL